MFKVHMEDGIHHPIEILSRTGLLFVMTVGAVEWNRTAEQFISKWTLGELTNFLDATHTSWFTR